MILFITDLFLVAEAQSPAHISKQKPPFLLKCHCMGCTIPAQQNLSDSMMSLPIVNM